MARAIAAKSLSQSRHANLSELAVVMPMHKDRAAANAIYDRAAAQIIAALAQAQDVAFLCEGDPFLFGSFAYVFERVAPCYNVEIVPGITAINAAAAITRQPLALLQENLTIISGRHSDQQVNTALRDADNVAIMKPGSRRQRLLELIDQAGRTKDGCYIEYVGHHNQKIITNLMHIAPGPGPYFALLLLHRRRNTRGAGQN